MEIKRMPNITLTLDEFFDMEDQEFAHGGEAVIFKTGNPNTLYKFFKDHNGNYIDMSDNKFKKILELYKLNLGVPNDFQQIYFDCSSMYFSASKPFFIAVLRFHS